MKTFKVSRLIRGNELFPSKIIINEIGVTITEPGFLNGKQRCIPFKHISSVMIDTPFIGYSTIEIQTTGQELVSLYGFTSFEVNSMRDIILGNIY
jgi:hypothetical protein